jgi:hypothetical protein
LKILDRDKKNRTDMKKEDKTDTIHTKKEICYRSAKTAKDVTGVVKKLKIYIIDP